MDSVTKVCRNNNCKHGGMPQSINNFYKRSGTSGHVSECKDCMKMRGNNYQKLPRGVSKVESENIALRYLASQGIVARPGKNCGMPDTDITAWDCVGIEVKLGVWSHSGRQKVCSFTITPKQQNRGILAHLIMMMIPRSGEYTYHIVPASHPIFFKDGKRKLAWTYVEDRHEAQKHGDRYVVFTEDIAEESQNAVHLIENMRHFIAACMRNGINLDNLLPCVSEPDWSLVDEKPPNYELG